MAWRRLLLGVAGVAGAVILLAGGGLFIWADLPAELSGSVLNSSTQGVEEVVLTAGENTTRLVRLSPGERRSFSFAVSRHEGSMAVRVRPAGAEELVAECHTYINWALSRADYHVELSAAGGGLQLRCAERSRELKF